MMRTEIGHMVEQIEPIPSSTNSGQVEAVAMTPSETDKIEETLSELHVIEETVEEVL